MSFAENLRRLRKEKGMTQDQLAKQIGVGKRAVIGYEIEGRYPKKHDIYQKIADALGCTTNDLLTDTDQFVAKAQEEYGSRGTGTRSRKRSRTPTGMPKNATRSMHLSVSETATDYEVTQEND